MADTNKVLTVETNGVELPYPTELLLIPANIPFSDPGFVATDLQMAVVEARNFSIRYVTGIILIVPAVQQMLLYQLLDIDNAELDLKGEVVIL